MTLSNNAIKFLQAQYRAIFKRAYIKGLATAVLLTAGLASGAANADVASGGFVAGSLIDGFSGGGQITDVSALPDVVLTKDQTINANLGSGDFTYPSEGGTQYKQNLGNFAKNLTIQSGDINLKLADSDNTFRSVVNVTDTLRVEGGSLTLGLNVRVEGSSAVYNPLPDELEVCTSNITGKLEVAGGTLNVTGFNSAIDVAGANFTGGTTNIGLNSEEEDAYAGVSQIYTGWGANPSNVTIENDAIVNLKIGGLLAAPQTSYFTGGELNFSGTKDLQAELLGGSGSGRALNFNGTEVNVTGYGKISGNALNVNGSDFTVADAAQLTISSESMTVSSGSMNNTGTVIVNADKLSVTDKYFNGLFTKKGDSQGKLNFSGSAINVDGVVDLNDLGIIDADGALTPNFTLKDKATLTADTISLGSAYKVGNLSLDADILNIDASSEDKNRFTFSSGTITVHDELNGSSEDQVLRIHGKDPLSNATLNLDAGANGGVLKNIDRINVGLGSSKGTSELTVTGNWNFNNARISVSSGGVTTIDGTVRNVSELMLEKDGDAIVNGALTIKRLLAGESESTNSNLTVNGTLTVTGDGKADKGKENFYNDVYLTQSTVTINNGGTLAIKGEDAVEDVIKVTTDKTTGEITAIEVPQTGSNKTEQGGWDKNKVKLKAGGTLSLDLGDITITLDQLGSLKENLVASGSKGSFDFGDGFKVDLSDSPELQKAIENKEVTYNALNTAGINDVKGIADGVTVTVTDKEATNGIHLSNGASSVKLEAGTEQVAVNGSLILNGTGGNFVYSEDDSGNQKVAGVTVKSGSGVNLTGAGTVGALVKNGSDTGTSAVLTAGQDATQTVQGEINLDTVTIGTGTVDVTESVTADKLTVNGNLNVSDGAGAITITGDSVATIAGSVQAGAISSSGGMDVTGTILAESISLAANKNLKVGNSSSSGLVQVETLNLNGGMLLIDPDWNQDASFVAVKGNVNTPDVIKVNGSIGVGRNSVGVIGATPTEAQDALSRLGLLQAGKLDAQGIGAALYLDDTLQIADQKHVLVDKNKDNSGLSTDLTSSMTGSGSVTLREGSALVISESFSNELVDDQNKAIFEFAATTGTVSVSAESGAQIIFDSADILGDDSVKVATAGGSITPDISGLSNAEITAAGGLLVGNLGTAATNDADKIKFTLAPNASTRLYNQSNPIRDMTLDVVGNRNGAYDSADYGVYYIGAMNAHNGGADIERTARMALYGGAVQATLMAQQTSTDAISERLGMANPNSALITSNNAQGGGLWLSPVYKNHDSDEFEAEGVNYGADIDLYGLALGADFTTESGVRVGAMFNVGSGDAEGQGIGEGVSNDFDYYGFSLYAGVTFGNFALTADAGFTQISNDLEQAVNYHGVGTLKADTDTQTVSIGVRGEYLFATPMVDIVPHIGMRYTSFDLDSYEAQVDGYTIASADADSMQLFSIPFGVTFSKELAMGNWVVKPVFDLNLTANAGDDELDSDVSFVGVPSVALTTEVMDSFTYGATLGVSAQYQESFSFGLNVGYTGSSSADEFGLNANARYTF